MSEKWTCVTMIYNLFTYVCIENRLLGHFFAPYSTRLNIMKTVTVGFVPFYRICNPCHHMKNTTTLNHLDGDALPAFPTRLLLAHLSLTHVTSSLTHKTNSFTILCCPHLPPIWPLEQTRWVRGWVAHSSLRIGEVLVVTAVSLRRFSQAEGAHRPGWGRPSPERGNFSGPRLRLSHRGFQMKGLLKRQEPFDCLLTALLLFVLNDCVLRAQRDNWALAIPLVMQP